MKKKKVITYIDLFSGIGGVRNAMELLTNDLNIESKCLAFSEIDNFATTSYKANYDTSKEIEMGDIVEFTKSKSNIEKLPDFDILFGGFPCQPFSMMGKQLGLDDERGGLFFSVAKILNVKKPRYVLLENVRNLYTHEKGKTYKKLKKELNKYGYDTQEDIFNTSDFGLPQHRRRLYIFATRKDLITNKDVFKADLIKEYSKKSKNKSIRYHKNVLDNILDLKEVDEKYYLSKKLKPTILSNGTKNFKSNSKINQLIARPLTATMAKMHRACQDNYYSQEFLNSKCKETYLENEFSKREEAEHKIRKLTPWEALKLQGFNKKFYINANKVGISNHQLYKQAGNAVSVNTVYSVIDYLLHYKLISLK